MLTHTRQNYHHSKLPAMGSIVILPTLDAPRQHRGWKTYPVYIVESCNVTDAPRTDGRYYSVGIHTVTLALLADRNQRRTVSGFYCEEIG
jgi:hypothetical protein